MCALSSDATAASRKQQICDVHTLHPVPLLHLDSLLLHVFLSTASAELGPEPEGDAALCPGLPEEGLSESPYES